MEFGAFSVSLSVSDLAVSQSGALEQFEDIRGIRSELLAAGIELDEDLDPTESGPAHVTLTDPDGNRILIDQFSPRPDSA